MSISIQAAVLLICITISSVLAVASQRLYFMQPIERRITMTTFTGSPVELVDVKLAGKSIRDSKKTVYTNGAAEAIELRGHGDKWWVNNLSLTFANRSNQPIVALSVDLVIKHVGLDNPISIPLGSDRHIPVFLDRELAKKIKPQILMPGEETTYSLRPLTLKLLNKQLEGTGAGDPITEVDIDLGRIQFDYDTSWNDGQIFHRDPSNPTRWVSEKAQGKTRTTGSRQSGRDAHHIAALDCWSASNDETFNCWALEFACTATDEHVGNTFGSYKELLVYVTCRNWEAEVCNTRFEYANRRQLNQQCAA